MKSGSDPAAFADPVSEEAASAVSAPAAEGSAAEPTETPPRPLGMISSEEERLNRFLTSIVQQDIVNTKTDLDEDAELVRFVFRYRMTNDPNSILEQKRSGIFCRALTLEQVNVTLTGLFGKSVSPDHEDYSILSAKAGSFHCVYRDGTFWNIPPYPAERYTFPVRFALVKRIDAENCTLRFRLYRMNPWIWGEDEAERHVGVLPSLDYRQAESSDVFTFLGEGDAVLRDLGGDLQLVELVVSDSH